MDPYNMLQEQLANITNGLQGSIQKLTDEVQQMSRRLDQIEQQTGRNTANVGAVKDKLESIKTRVEYVPKIYNNQVAQLDTLLRGHQFQYKSISNIINRDHDEPTFAEANAQQLAPAPSQSALNAHAHHQDDDDSLADVANGDHHHHHLSMERVAAATPQQNNNTGRIVPQNRVNQSPVSLSMMENSNSSRSGNSSQTAQTSTVSSSALPRFNIISELNNDEMTLPNLQGSGSSNDEGLTSIGDVVGDDSSRMWDAVPFRHLNAHPKSVEDILSEYYYGFEGQPPLKYLEKYRKDWRKGNKNLSKTFCRRYRIITAVEQGIRHNMSEYGLSESVARDRVVGELEAMRIKENGKKETMYWLFHHVPQHLKRR